MKLARARWNAYQEQMAKKTILELLQDLTSESARSLDEVLKVDKKVGRSDLRKAAIKNRKLIVDRLVAGSLAQAELMRRSLGWTYNGDKFFHFIGAPEFIAPPSADSQ
jgi:hypothetical protein